MVSDARREANRKNALRSTGPKSEEGKARSARNAQTHGLTAMTVAVDGEDGRNYRERLTAFRDQFGPRDVWQGWLIEQVAGVSLRLARIERTEDQLRKVASWRASALWDEDRRLDVEKVGAGLERDPAKVVATLRQSPHGCDWLIERWAALARIADGAGANGWTEGQNRLALDLLGTPQESRVGPPGVVIDEEGRITGHAPAPLTLARSQIAELQALRNTVGEVDEFHREMVEEGLNDVPSREIAILRRYERATHRRLYWLTAQMRESGLRPQQRTVRGEQTTQSTGSRIEPTSDPAQPPSQKRRDVVVERKERNEPILSSQIDETKPLPVELVADPGKSERKTASESTLVPPRKRPDPAKLVRLEREKRRNRRSA